MVAVGHTQARWAGACKQLHAVRCASYSTHPAAYTGTCCPPLHCGLTPPNPVAAMAPACRDVYLLVKPREHIADFYARTPLQFDATTGKPCAAR